MNRLGVSEGQGNTGVFYDDEGRVYYQGEDSSYPARGTGRGPGSYNSYDPNYDRRNPRSPLPNRPGGAAYSEGDLRGGFTPVTRNNFYRPTQSVDRLGLPRSDERSRPSPSQGYSVDPKPDRHNRNGYVPDDPYYTERKRRSRQDQSPMGWSFIVNAILMFIAGIVNAVLCFEAQYYCRFWTGIIVLQLGIIGVVHKKRYKSTYMNVHYILSGILVLVVAFVSTGLVLSTFCSTLIDIGMSGDDIPQYERMYELSLMQFKPIVNISADARLWLCLSVDGATLLLLMVDYLSLAGVILVADVHMEQKYQVNSTQLEPFCRPGFFNPFSQMLVSEAVIFIGLVTVFACQDEYKMYWGPVWAGVIALMAGGVSAYAGKKQSSSLQAVAGVVSQIISVLAAIAALVLCSIGLANDIKEINKDSTQGPQKSVLSASAVIFGIADMVLLVIGFVSFGIMVRHIIHLCMDYDKNHGYYRHREPYDYSRDYQGGYTGDRGGYPTGPPPPGPPPPGRRGNWDDTPIYNQY